MEDAVTAEPSQLRIWILCVSGWFVGSFVSILSLLALLAWTGTSITVNSGTFFRLLGALFSLSLGAIGCFVGTLFCRSRASWIGYFMGLTFYGIGLYSCSYTGMQARWPFWFSYFVAISAMMTGRLLQPRVKQPLTSPIAPDYTYRIEE